MIHKSIWIAIKRWKYHPQIARKSRQMQFHDKTAYVWGLRYRWDPSLSMNPVCRFAHFMPPCMWGLWRDGCKENWRYSAWFHGLLQISVRSEISLLIGNSSIHRNSSQLPASIYPPASFLSQPSFQSLIFCPITLTMWTNQHLDFQTGI